MIYVNNHAHGRVIMEAAGAKYTPETMTVISRGEGGELYGGVIYENWSGEGGSVVVHIAGFNPHWINRDILFMMFDYPFNQLRCNQAFAQVRAKNVTCLKFCQSVGWEEVITLDAVYPDDDMVLLRMRRENCRFLGLKPRNVRSRKGDLNG